MRAETERPETEARLARAGIRPTRQRVALAELIFGQGRTHMSAEELHARAHDRCAVSLATVYNTLKQFNAAGLLREVATPGQTAYFCTNMSDHQHFYDDKAGTLTDIGANQISIHGLPEAPLGKQVARVDVIVHLVDA